MENTNIVGKARHYGDLSPTAKAVENNVRRTLKKEGYKLMRLTGAGYMILDANTNEVVAGGVPAFSFSLVDVEIFAIKHEDRINGN